MIPTTVQLIDGNESICTQAYSKQIQHGRKPNEKIEVKL